MRLGLGLGLNGRRGGAVAPDGPVSFGSGNVATAASSFDDAQQLVAVIDAESDNGWNDAGFIAMMRFGGGTYVSTVFSSGFGAPRVYGGGDALVSSGHPASGRVQWRIRRLAATSADLAWRTDEVVDPSASGWTVSASNAITDGLSPQTVVTIGGNSSGTYFAGDVYWASVTDGTDTVVFDPSDLSAWTIT